MGVDDGASAGFWIFFIACAGVIVFVIVMLVVRGLHQWTSNNHAPLVTEPAVLVAKREHHRRSAIGDGTGRGPAGPAVSSYSATFEVPGGERIELFLPSREYGLLAEGDRGDLTRQGSRYKGFTRTPQDR